MNRIFTLFLTVVVLGIVAVALNSAWQSAPAPVLINQESNQQVADEIVQQPLDNSALVQDEKAVLGLPLDQAKERVTKKPFGIKISPTNSPVSPERFSGYHTGVDFEIFSSEEDIDVVISAVCDGKVVLARRVSGYGGVLIQSCQLAEKAVTVLYGHLRLASFKFGVGDEVSAGEEIGVLGTGYSTETDNERKHLHLSIHLGSAIELRGYVQQQSELKDWLNVMDYL